MVHLWFRLRALYFLRAPLLVTSQLRELLYVQTKGVEVLYSSRIIIIGITIIMGLQQGKSFNLWGKVLLLPSLDVINLPHSISYFPLSLNKNLSPPFLTEKQPKLTH